MVQEQYWQELCQLRVHANSIELYYQGAANWERGISIFLAVASSGSIAGWLMWEEAFILWALIIGISQVIVVIKEFLPFKTRVASLPALTYELEQLANSAEKDWVRVAGGELTEKEINELWHEIKSKKTDHVHKALEGGTLPTQKNILAAAEESTEVYFNHFYPS